MEKAELTFQIPEYMVILLLSYSDEGCIDLDKFIEKAIKYNYKKVIPYTLGTIDNSYYDEETLPIRVTISKSLAEALSLSAFMYHSSLSAIFIEILIVVLKKLEYVFDIIYDYDLNLVVDGAGEVWWVRRNLIVIL